MSACVETMTKNTVDSFKDMFMLKMKELADKHSSDPVKYFVVMNPDDQDINTVFKNKLFKTTSKYDLWLRVNELTRGRLYYYEDDDEKYLNEVIYDILYDEYEGEDEFDYSAVTPEKKLDVFVKYIIEQMEEGVDYQSHYWVELSLD